MGCNLFLLDFSSGNPFIGKDSYNQDFTERVAVLFGAWAPEQHSIHTFSIDYNQSFSVKDDISVEANWKAIKTIGL